MSMTGMAIGVTLSLTDRLSAPLKGVMGGIERLSTKLAAAGAAAHALSAALSGVSQRAQAIAMQSAQAFMAFDDARAVLASMPGVTDAALTQITNRARAFTRENKVTLAEYLDTTYNILSAGIPEALANYATEVSVKVAQATRGATAEAGEAVAILYNNMRDPTREMTAEFARMGDAITATQQRFQLKNLAQLTEGLKYATPAAKTARLAVEDMNAALGRLNSAGLQGSMAGTALANMLANRFKAAKEIGFKVAVKKGTGELDLLRTLENLKRAVGDVNKLTPEMEAKLRKGFGDEGFRAVMLLLGQTDQLKEDLEAIRNSAGSFERASKIINESAGAKWQQAMNRINDLWLRLGEAMKPALDWLGEWIVKLTDGINALLDRFPSLSKWIGAAVIGVAGLSAGLAAVGTALIGLAALGKLRQIKGILGGLLGKCGGKSAEGGLGARVAATLAQVGNAALAVLSPIAKLTAAFAGGYAIGTLLSKGIDALLTRLMGMPTTLGGAIYDGVQAIKAAWNDGVAWVSSAADRIIDGLLAGLRERWAALKEGVSNIGSSITGWVKDKLGIRSPSRVFAEIGRHLMGGLQLGIERAASLPLAAMRGVAAGLTAPMSAGGIAIGAMASGMPMAAGAAPIQITVNLNGPASPEAAQDVAAAVRREVERALAEQARREGLARRARLIDGGAI